MQPGFYGSANALGFCTMMFCRSTILSTIYSRCVHIVCNCLVNLRSSTQEFSYSVGILLAVRLELCRKLYETTYLCSRYKDETHEFTVTATKLLPTGASTKTATCQCTRGSCKRCRGNPVAALSEKCAYSQKERGNFDIANNCEEGSLNGNYKSPRKQLKYDSGNKNECEEPPHQYASKDTFIYNELQKDIQDLKEIVKNTRFGNCPCCKCCKCEPENSGKPCPTNADGSRNNPPQEAKNPTKPVNHSAVVCKDTAKQKNGHNKQPQHESEPSAPHPSEASYFGTTPANALKRISAHKGPESSIIAENEDKLKGIPHKQEDIIPSTTKGSNDTDLRANTGNEVQPDSSHIEGSTSKAEAVDEAAKEPTIASISTKLNSPENAIEAKKASPSSPSLVSSSILKESSKDKIESRTIPKKVEIDEPLKVPSNDTAGRGFGYPDDQESGLTRDSDFGPTRKPRQSGSEQVVHKTVSNISFGSKKSVLSTTSSRKLVLSPEQEALFQSRERLRGFSSQGTDVSDSLHDEAKETRKHVDTTEDVQSGFFQRIFGGKTKPEITEKSAPSDESESNPDGSVSGDSTTDICSTLLDMETMPCRFWSSETTPNCKNVDTYVVVLETETSNGLATRDETFIISDNIPINSNNQIRNEYKKRGRVKKSEELEKSIKGNLIQQSAYLASKSTSTIWKGITSPIGIIRDLCKLPSGPTAHELTVELPTEALKRKLSKRVIRKPAKKLISPLNVSNHYSHVRYKMPRSRDSKRPSAGALRAYSSDSVKKTSTKLRKTEDKGVQVKKWNAMTQTAGPRKFNRTDISKEIEDKLARYLGLER